MDANSTLGAANGRTEEHAPNLGNQSSSQELLDLLPAAVYVCALDGTIVRFNRRAAELWGRAPLLNDPRDRFCGSYRMYRADGDALPHDECPMADILRDGIPVVDQEVNIERPDGSRAVALVNIRPLTDAAGNITGAVNCFYDITERKHIDQEFVLTRGQVEEITVNLAQERDQSRADFAHLLRLQEISTRLLHQNDLDMLLGEILDAAIEITRAGFGNIQLKDKASSVLRIVTQRGFEQEFLDFFNSVHEGMAACGAAMQKAERVIVEHVANSPLFKGTPAGEIMVKAGALAVQSTPLVSRSGELLGMFSTHWARPHRPSQRDLGLLDVLARQAADLIERKQGEQSDRRLVAIVDSSHDAIVSKDLNGIITTWNPGAEQLFGYTAEEAIGKSVTVLIPAERHNEEPEILERVRRGERVEHYETVRLRKNGTLIDISLSVSPIKDASGNVIGASKIARDITDRKRAQERQELLTQEIHHRTKNLFSVVQAVVTRSFMDKRTVKEAEHAVISRLHSLAQTHVMLIDKEWQGADLAEVVRTEMSPYAGRVTIEGPTVVLNAKAAQNFALAVHELATNAVKYGALSNQSGRVHISWSVGKPNGHDQFMFRWQEHNGPQVSPPSRKGFGSTVLEQVMAEYFETPPQIEFAADGVGYEVVGSLEAITNHDAAT